MPFNCFGLYLCRATERCTCVQSNQLGGAIKTPAQTEDWLRKFSNSSMTMTGLRDVAARCGSLNLKDNGAVIRLIAQQICSGQLRVCSTGTRAGAGDPGGGAAATDSKPFPLTDLKKRPPQSSSSDRPADPNTFSDDMDSQAQAAALTAAASKGQPFCPE